ncbi:MAG: hypothetical protein MK008_07460 [Bdellovibrionales bacterium]|nr:hypothetical protein [Bdellovibrionales bacterium]
MKILSGLFLFLFTTSSFAAFQGTYKLSYETALFTQMKSIEVTLGELQQGSYGDIEIKSEELGVCNNKKPASSKYGFAVIASDNEPLTKIRSNNVSRIFADVACENGWHQIVIEIPEGPMPGMDEVIEAGFYIRNSSKAKTILDKMAKMERLK